MLNPEPTSKQITQKDIQSAIDSIAKRVRSIPSMPVIYCKTCGQCPTNIKHTLCCKCIEPNFVTGWWNPEDQTIKS
jgi:predicted aldo/keto reductase-like oxidoreductase